MTYFIPIEDNRHNLFYAAWAKTDSNVHSVNNHYQFALWLIKQGIEPKYSYGYYIGCEFKNKKELLGWMLKNS